MKFIFIIASLLLSFQVYADTELYGEWRGAGDQDNGSHWTIRINAQKDFVMIDYPSLVCGGILKPVKSKDTQWLFKEKLIYGIEHCLNHGDVVLNKSEQDKLYYFWFGENGLLQATGQLDREFKKPSR